MFTGIIEATGSVASIQPNDFGARLLISPDKFAYQPLPGDSIAVNGVCLTHAPREGESTKELAFDVIRETLARTSLGELQPGSSVNLEASLRADTPIAGHFVQGHVDGLGTVAEVDDGADEWRTTIEVEPALMKYIVPKGSIAIDGVSLTIATVDIPANRFSVALIPTTLKRTTLTDRKVGDRVNLETDMIARTVVHYLELRRGGEATLTLDKLRDAGFAE